MSIKPLIPATDGEEEIIVSLTSYGRRVKSTVYYSILSIFNQRKRPNKIILWLDNKNWNEDNIPQKLKNLQTKGLDIKFTSDIRSYKKLIPTLELYPKSIIITIDDDVIYSSKLIENLYESYRKNPLMIHCTHAKWIPSDSNEIDKYSKWELVKSKSNNHDMIIFPVGIGGILYPPNSLDTKVMDKELFMKLCPQADDIWFWYMAKRNKTEHNYVECHPSFYSFDAIYQAFHRGSALTHMNVGENQNDLQLKALLNYFGVGK